MQKPQDIYQILEDVKFLGENGNFIINFLVLG